MQKNQQLSEPIVTSGDGYIHVFDMFYTIQGEGPHSGTPALFIRLAGCNLQCNMCDTDYTSKRTIMHYEVILTKVKEFPAKLIVLTGGEPLRQDIEKLVELLLEEGYRVQVETNGTIYREWIEYTTSAFPKNLHFVISPKTSKIDRGWSIVTNSAVSYKYVMSCKYVHSEDGLPTSVLGKLIIPARPFPDHKDCEVFLQPEDSLNEKWLNSVNIQACCDSCLVHGYRLCLQVQKIVNLP